MSETFLELVPYAEAVARDATQSRPWLEEDVRQEALLAAWQAVESGAGRDPRVYGKTAARHAAYDAVVRGRSTGSERRSGGHSGVVRDIVPLEVDGELVTDLADQRAADAFERAGLHSRVTAAVLGLEPEDRAYVWLRFWAGRTAREIGAELGLSEAATAARWHQRIRPRLRERLADLAA